VTAALELDATARPRLLRGVRLKHDAVRGGEVLLAPERVVRADPVAVAILQRCDGARTLDNIVDELCEAYKGDRARIDRDVRALLADLIAKRMIAL